MAASGCLRFPFSTHALLLWPLGPKLFPGALPCPRGLPSSSENSWLIRPCRYGAAGTGASGDRRAITEAAGSSRPARTRLGRILLYAAGRCVRFEAGPMGQSSQSLGIRALRCPSVGRQFSMMASWNQGSSVRLAWSHTMICRAPSLSSATSLRSSK